MVHIKEKVVEKHVSLEEISCGSVAEEQKFGRYRSTDQIPNPLQPGSQFLPLTPSGHGACAALTRSVVSDSLRPRGL